MMGGTEPLFGHLDNLERRKRAKLEGKFGGGACIVKSTTFPRISRHPITLRFLFSRLAEFVWISIDGATSAQAGARLFLQKASLTGYVIRCGSHTCHNSMQELTRCMCTVREQSWTSSASDCDAFSSVTSQIAAALDAAAPLMPELVACLNGRVHLVMRTRWLSVATTARYLTNAKEIQSWVEVLLQKDQRARAQNPPASLLTDALRTQLVEIVLVAMSATWYQWRALFISSFSAQIFRAKEGSPARLRTLLPFLESNRAFNAFAMHETLSHVSSRLHAMEANPERWFPAAFEYAAMRSHFESGLREEIIGVMRRSIVACRRYLFGDWRKSSQVAPNFSQWYESELLPAALLAQDVHGRVTAEHQQLRVAAAKRLQSPSMMAQLKRSDPLGLLGCHRTALLLAAAGHPVSAAFELSIVRLFSSVPTSGHYAEEMVKVGKDRSVVKAQMRPEAQQAAFCAELRENDYCIDEQAYARAQAHTEEQAERVRVAQQQLDQTLKNRCAGAGRMQNYLHIFGSHNKQ